MSGRDQGNCKLVSCLYHEDGNCADVACVLTDEEYAAEINREELIEHYETRNHDHGRVLAGLVGKRVIVDSYLMHVGGTLETYDSSTTEEDDPTYSIEWAGDEGCLSTVFDLAEVVRVDECYFTGYGATIVLNDEDTDGQHQDSNSIQS